MRISSCAPAVVLFAATAAMGQTVDPNYGALRNAVPEESYIVDNTSLSRDVGGFAFRTGTLTFLSPVQERRMLAVFRGEGTFELAPAIVIERDYLKRVTGQEKPTVAFQRMLLAFSDATYEEIKKTAKQS